MKLNVSAFAIAFGIWWGVGLFVLTWWLIAVGGPADQPFPIARVYPGYDITPLGSVVGLAWGLVCGGICGGIFAWLYNTVAKMLGADAGTLVGKPT